MALHDAVTSKLTELFIDVPKADIRIGEEFFAQATQKAHPRIRNQRMTTHVASIGLEFKTAIPQGESNHLIVPTTNVQLKTIPVSFLTCFCVPKAHLSFKEWSVVQRERIVIPSVHQQLKYAINLIEAVREMHEVSNSSSFLVDLSMEHSIWVSMQGQKVKLMARNLQNSFDFDKKLIFQSYISQLRGDFVSLYPPEMVSASLNIDSSAPIPRTHLQDSWAVGIMILLILRHPHKLIPNYTKMPYLIKNLKFKNKESRHLLKGLFQGIFTSAEKRLTLTKISEIIHNIMKNEEEDGSTEEEMNSQKIDDIEEYIDNYAQNREKLGILQEINYTDFKDTIKDCIISDPNNRRYILLLAKVLTQREQTKAAMHQFNRLLKLNENDDDLYYHMGLLNIIVGNEKEAISNLKKCLAINKARSDAKYQLGCIYLKLEDHQEQAINEFEKALKIDENNPTILKKAALAYRQHKDNYAGAYTKISSIKDLRKEYLEEYEDYFKAHWNHQRMQMAGKLLPAATSEECLQLGNIAQALKEYHQAITAFTKSLEKKPANNIKSLLGLCECYIATNNIAQAFETQNKILRIFDDEHTIKENESFKLGYLAFARIQGIRNNQGKMIQSYIECIKRLEENDPQKREIIAEFLVVQKQFLDVKIASCCKLQDLPMYDYSICFKFSTDIWISAIQLEEKYKTALMLDYNSKEVKCTPHQVLRCIGFRQILSGQLRLGVGCFKLSNDMLPGNFETKFDIIASECVANSSEMWKGKKSATNCRKDLLEILNSSDKDEIAHLSALEKRQRILKGFSGFGALTPLMRAKAQFNLSLVPNADDPNAAEDLCKNAIADYAYDADYHYTLAVKLLEKDKTATSSEHVKECLKIHPFHVPMLRSVLAAQEDNSDVSSNEVRQQLLEAERQNEAMKYLMKGQYKKCLIEVQKCGRFNPGNMLARHFTKQTDVIAYLKQFKEFISSSPTITLDTVVNELITFEADSSQISDYIAGLGQVESFVGEFSDDIRSFVEKKIMVRAFLMTRKYSSALELLPSLVVQDATLWNQLLHVRLIVQSKEIQDNHITIIQECLSNTPEENYSYRYYFSIALAQSLLLKNKGALNQPTNDAINEAVKNFMQLCSDKESKATVEFKECAMFQLADMYLLSNSFQRSSEISSHSYSEFYDALIEIRFTLSNLGHIIRMATEQASDSCDKQYASMLNDCVLNRFGHSICKGFCFLSKALELIKKEKFEKALVCMKQAIKADESNESFSLQYVNLLIVLKQYDEAEEILDNLSQTAKEMKYFIAGFQGICASRRGNYKEALNLLFQYVQSVVESKGTTKEDDYTQFQLLKEVLEQDTILEETWQFLEEIAYVYEKTNNIDSAEKIYKKSFNYRPSHVRTSILFGQMLERQDNQRQAYEVYVRVLKYESNDSNSWFELAKQIYLLEGHKQAIVALKKCVEARPLHPTAYRVMADYHLKNNYKDTYMAEVLLRRQIQINKSDTQSYSALGVLLLENGDSEGAIKVFTDALQFVSLSQKEFFYEQIIKMNEKDERKLRLIVLLIKKQSEDFPEKKKSNLLRMARIYQYKIKEIPEAIATYLQYLELDSGSISVQFELACLYLSSKNYEKAEKSLKWLVEAHPKMYEAHIKLSSACLGRGNTEEAKEAVLRGLELEPHHIQGLANYGKILMIEKQFPEALTVLEDCMHYSDGRQLEIYNYLGQIYNKLELYDESTICYSVALEANPQDQYVQMWYAQALIRQNKHKEAQIVLKKPCLNEQHVMRLYLLGEAHFQLHEFKEAYQYFKDTATKISLKYVVRSMCRLFRQLIYTQSQGIVVTALNSQLKEGQTKRKREFALSCYLLAEVSLSLGSLSEAQEKIEQCENVTGFPLDELFITKARLQFLKTKNADEAQKILQRVPLMSHVRKTFEFKLLDFELISQKDAKLSIDDHLIGCDTRDAEAWVQNEVLYLDAVQQYKHGGDSEKVKLKLFPLLPSVHALVLYSQILTKQGNLIKAEDILMNNKKNYDTNNLFWIKEIGNVSALLQKADQAIIYFQQFCTINQSDPEVNVKMVEQLIIKQRWLDAEELLRGRCFESEQVPTGAYLAQAKIYLQQEQYLKVIESVRVYIESQTSCVQGYLTLGSAYKGLKMFDEEKATYETGLKMSPDNSQQLFIRLGNSLKNLKLHEQLRNVISEMKDTYKSSFEVSFHLGVWLIEVGDLKEAQKYLMQCHLEQEKNPDVVELLLKVLLKLEEWLSVIHLLKSDKNIKLRNSDVLLQIGQLLFDREEFENTIYWTRMTQTEKILENLQKYILLAKASHLIKDHAQTQNYIKQCTKYAQKDCPIEYRKEVMLLKAVTSMEKGDQFKEPESILRDLLAIDRNQPRILILLGYCYYKMNNFEQAESLLAESSSLEPNTANSIALRGLLQLRTAMLQEDLTSSDKERIYNEILNYSKQHSSHDLIIVLLGRAQFWQANYKAAIDSYSTALSNQKKHLTSIYDLQFTKAEWRDLRFMIAKAYKEVGNNQEAIQALVQLSEISLLDTEANIYLARLYFNNHDYHDVMRVINKHVYKVNPDERYLLLFAEVKTKQGYYEDALSTLKKCVAINPNYAEAQALLALTKKKLNVDGVYQDLKQALKLNPENIEIIHELLRLSLKNNSFTDFNSFYEQLSQLSSTSSALTPEIITLNAISLSKQGRFDESLATLQSSLLVHPNNIDILIGIAKIYRLAGNTADEIKAYEKVLEITSLKPSMVTFVMKKVAYCHLMIGQFAEAEEVYTYLALNDDISDVVMYVYDLALSQIAQAKYSQPLTLLKKYVQQYRYDENLSFLLAFTHSKMGETSAAIQFYSRCLEINPSFIQAALNLAILYRKTRKFKEAQAVISQIQLIFPKHLSITYHEALNYIANGSPYHAVSILKEALNEFTQREKITSELKSQSICAFKQVFKQRLQESEPIYDLNELIAYQPKEGFHDLVAFNLLLATALRRFRQYNESVSHLEHWIVQDPDNVYYSFSLAISHFQNRDVNQGIYEINRCSSLDPKNTQIYQFILSNMLHQIGEYGQEISILFNNSRYEAVTNLGCAYAKYKNYGEAIVSFRKAIELRPTCANAHFNLGNVLLLTRDIAGAIHSYKECLNLKATHEQCLQNLASAYVCNNQLKEAVDCLQACLEINPIHNQRLFKKLSAMQKRLILSESQK